MKSDVISIDTYGTGFESALLQADLVASYKQLSPAGSLHLRLLTEELMALMRSITGKKEASFWIEDQDGVFRLHLSTETPLDPDKRAELLAASTSGKNEASKGLLGKIRSLFDFAAETDCLVGLPPMMLDGMTSPEDSMGAMEWSLELYRSQLETRYSDGGEEAREAKDELEKSVIANVADEVKVSIKGWHVEMTVFKKLC